MCGARLVVLWEVTTACCPLTVTVTVCEQWLDSHTRCAQTKRTPLTWAIETREEDLVLALIPTADPDLANGVGRL